MSLVTADMYTWIGGDQITLSIGILSIPPNTTLTNTKLYPNINIGLLLLLQSCRH